MNQYARLPYKQLLKEVQDWLDIYRSAFSAFKLGRPDLLGRIEESSLGLGGIVGMGEPLDEPLTHDNAIAIREVFKRDEILQQVALNYGFDYNNLDELARSASERGFKSLYAMGMQITIPRFENLTELASQTSGTLSTALLMHLHTEVRDSGLMNGRRHEEGLNLEYSLLQEVARERGYGDISHETLRRFSPVGKKVRYATSPEPGEWGLSMPADIAEALAFHEQKGFVPIPILPIPPVTTEEEGRAKEFLDNSVKDEPQYGFKLPELEGKGPHLVHYREDDWVPY